MFNQTNIGTVSRATLGRLLRDRVEHMLWALQYHPEQEMKPPVCFYSKLPLYLLPKYYAGILFVNGSFSAIIHTLFSLGLLRISIPRILEWLMRFFLGVFSSDSQHAEECSPAPSALLQQYQTILGKIQNRWLLWQTVSLYMKDHLKH